MAHEQVDLRSTTLTRWVILAALVVAGVVLFLWLAPGTPSAMPPVDIGAGA